MLLGLSTIAPAVRAQFSSGVSLVEVYATVVDQRGEPVAGLRSDDFEVEEDGRPQTISVFTAGDIPLSLAIAIDRSFSLPRAKLTDAVTATQRLLGELRPEDRVLLLAVGSQVETLSALSIDHRAAYEALRGLDSWGTTPLFDATVAALDAIQAGSGRRALILISDGSDRYSQTSEADAVNAARHRDVIAYPIALQRTVPPFFVELAAATGGRSSSAPDGRALSAGLSSIATELRRQYLIGYAPAAASTQQPGWRSISVRVKRPGLRVRARDGYYAVR
jgi:Ca-activated chloride channel family protein